MSDLDHLYARAVSVVTAERKASTSFVQRKLQIGYNTAAALMERMEAEGVVGPADYVGKREILIDAQPAPESAGATSSPAVAGEVAGEVPPEGASQPQPAPQPEPEALYSGPTKRFTCDGCDLEATGPVDGLPLGWWTQTSGTLGTLFKCQTCAARSASRIATEHMTTEQIMSAGSDGAQVDEVTAAAQGRLKSYIDRLQRLREDALAVAGDMKDVFADAKGEGFDTKVMRRLLTEMSKDQQKRQEEQTLLELYASAIGFNL